MDFELHSLEETRAAAREFVSTLSRGQKATIVGLRGDLGAGKTTFVKMVAEALGVEEVVTSPTFVIEKIYKLPSGQVFEHLVHIDAYRLESGSELTDLGWSDLIADAGNLVLVEWPELVSGVMPDGAIYLEFEVVDEDTRRIKQI